MVGGMLITFTWFVRIQTGQTASMAVFQVKRNGKQESDHLRTHELPVHAGNV